MKVFLASIIQAWFNLGTFKVISVQETARTDIDFC